MNRQPDAGDQWLGPKPEQRVRIADAMLGPGGVRGSNFFTADERLRPLLSYYDAAMLSRCEEQFTDFGAWVGSTVDAQAEYTDAKGPPYLETYDRNGDRVNRVSYNPRYAACQRELYRRGFIALNYGRSPAPFLAGFTLGYLLSKADLSLHLPAALSGAVAYVLAFHAPEELRRAWLPGMLRTDGTALMGATWTTERSGGGDLGGNVTEVRRGGEGPSLYGVKSFASSADCDLALVTARPDGAAQGSAGLGVYLVPRRLASGSLNRYTVRRLKTKIGTRGLATGEVELAGAVAQVVAEPGAGVQVLQDAVGYARIHNAMAGAAIQRRALLESIDNSSRHGRFGRRLTNDPAVQDVLLTLRCDYEADLALAFAAAAAFDDARHHPALAGWLRLLTVMAKFRASRNVVKATQRCIELFGGNGYVEDFVCGRLHRDALALGTWVGSANVLGRDLVVLLSDRLDTKQRFGRAVREKIDKAPLRASRLAAGMRRALAEYEEAARYLQRFPESGERLGVRLLEFMADLFAAALMLEQAGRGIELGDARMAVMLDGFLRRYFPDDAKRLTVKTSECLRMFEALITGTPVPADSDWEKSLRSGL